MQGKQTVIEMNRKLVKEKIVRFNKEDKEGWGLDLFSRILCDVCYFVVNAA